jgi:hypothetical protein
MLSGASSQDKINDPFAVFHHQVSQEAALTGKGDWQRFQA